MAGVVRFPTLRVRVWWASTLKLSHYPPAVLGSTRATSYTARGSANPFRR
jgi:hypothetical protein